MDEVTEKLTKDSPAICFFPDTKGDNQGKMMLALLKVSVK
jgi:hypothetical protein